MTTLTTPKATNSIVYKTNKIVGNEHVFVTIRLNDECTNGHQDFSITADIYEAGKPKIDKYHISGGCCHDDILKAFPEFKIFVDLHLCDYKGIPMYAVQNGYYHMHEGFNSKSIGEAHKNEFCEYYRVTPVQYDSLMAAPSKILFAYLLKDLGVLHQWEMQANKAISMLESLTGLTFVVDSVRTQYNEPSLAELTEETNRLNNGYYSPSALQDREKAKQDKYISDLIAQAEKKISEIREDLDIDIQAYKIGGQKAKDQIIYYKHTKKVKINWRDYDRLPENMVDKLKLELVLPAGVSFESN